MKSWINIIFILLPYILLSQGKIYFGLSTGTTFFMGNNAIAKSYNTKNQLAGNFDIFYSRVALRLHGTIIELDKIDNSYYGLNSRGNLNSAYIAMLFPINLYKKLQIKTGFGIGLLIHFHQVKDIAGIYNFTNDIDFNIHKNFYFFLNSQYNYINIRGYSINKTYESFFKHNHQIGLNVGVGVRLQ